MNKVNVSEMQGPLTELMEQVGGQNGRARFDEFKLWLKGVVLSALEALIDLSVPCKLPFNGAERVSPAKSGIVKLERRGDDLYIDGKKIELFLSAGQKGDSYIVGHDLRKELEARGGNLSGSVLDHLEAHPELWPESWKKDSQGNTIYVFFWDDIFRYSDGYLYVRYGYWRGGRVVSNYNWLDNNWNGNNPAASVATLFISLLLWQGSFVSEDLLDPFPIFHSNHPAFCLIHPKGETKQCIFYYPEP